MQILRELLQWPFLFVAYWQLLVKPSLSLWLTIRLSLSSAYLVTLIYIKFSSGPVANLWPGWIVQLTHNSFAWRTLQNVSTNADFVYIESE